MRHINQCRESSRGRLPPVEALVVGSQEMDESADPGRVMQAVIVSAESAARRALRECCAREPNLSVLAEYSDSGAALETVRGSPPDVLFLDVHRAPLATLAFARALDPASPTKIVLVSASDRFARDAFEVNAVDFLITPFDDARFRHALARIRRRVHLERLARRQLELSDVLYQLEQSAKALRQSHPRILADSGGRMRVLDVGDIELIESDKNYVNLTVGRDRYTVRGTMQHAEAAMGSQRLLRVSRSRLVNLTHVRELGRTPRGDVIVVLTGGVTVTASERYRHAIRQQLSRMQLSVRAC
jgi:two-component system LytT family response regulator